jgi:RHS repeat-associated protein
MRAALHRAAKTGSPRRAATPRAAAHAGAHASRWDEDEPAARTPRPRRLRAERRAWRSPPGGGGRVGEACHYGYDAHGDITFLTDATGDVTDTYDYDACGSVVASSGSTPNTRLYEGQEFDPDLGLINMRARQYQPSTGRFLTIDPVMGDPLRPLTLNRYHFADADPVNLWDPNGTFALTYINVAKVGIAITGAALAAMATRMAAMQMARYFEGVDSGPTPPDIEPQKPGCGPLLAALYVQCKTKVGLDAAWCYGKLLRLLYRCVSLGFHGIPPGGF